MAFPNAALAQWDKDVLELRGRMALQDGKYAAAIEHFNILEKLDTTDQWTFFFRGIAKYNLGDLRGAYKDFDRSVRINPVFTNGYHYRAITKSRFGQYDEALEDFQKAIDLRPGLIGLYFSRGVTYFLAQRFEEAVADFDKYIRHEPKDPSAYLNRGASYLFLCDTLKALTDYNHAIRLDRFEPEGYVRRARVYAAQEDYDLAITDMDHAIELDPANTFAYFNRALMFFETSDYVQALQDLNTVLKHEPGNALTLYNRSLVRMQLGDSEGALEDMDRVININPNNVLAYFNRAGILIDLGRFRSAIGDYDRAIELYPDFAKAYQNRAYVENLLGMRKESKRDYDIARRKIQEYESQHQNGSFADTTKKYSSLLALDADFAKKDFDDEKLQNREVDIRLKPLFRFRLADQRYEGKVAFSNRYENAALDKFIEKMPVPVEIALDNKSDVQHSLAAYDARRADINFLKGMREIQNRQYSAALGYYNAAIDGCAGQEKAFYLVNRAALRAEMIEFIASIESNVQTLTMDDQGATKARVNDRAERSYDYSEVLADLEEAVKLAPANAYIHYNLGNIRCLSSQPVLSIGSYDRAIELHPQMGEAYFNRGLVLIFLKDREKGCIDLSRAGELGIKDAYPVISKYCKEGEN